MTFSVLTRPFFALLLICAGVALPAFAERIDDSTISEERTAMRVWIMRHAIIGSRFELQDFRNRLGPVQTLTVTNRSRDIVGHYFPLADVTIFENTAKNSLVVWRPGRVDTL
jgi:hypothetical protein